MDPIRWFDREFDRGIEVGAFPAVVERLRGAPSRVEEKLRQISPDLAQCRVGESWSVLENVGHLLDLEPLWLGRLSDLLTGKETLRPADLTNRKTHEANHNEAAPEDLAASFRRARLDLVQRLDALDAEDVSRTALHPRLKTPMRVIDLCLFVAEHDDHHLARTTALSALD